MKKVIHFLSQYIGKGFLLLMTFGLLVSCEENYKLEIPFAVNSNEINLTEDGGSTSVMIYSTGSWTVSLSDKVNWASLNKLKGKGNGSVVFSYSQNAGAPRRVKLMINKGGEIKEVLIVQAGNIPTLKFKNGDLSIPKMQASVYLPLTSNLKYDAGDIKMDVLYDDEFSEQWVSDVKITEKAFEFVALANNTGHSRAAMVILLYTDGWGNEYTAVTNITQTAEIAYVTPSPTETRIIKYATSVVVGLDNNVLYSFPYFTQSVTYSAGLGWISNIALEGGQLTFDVDLNETGMDRSAVITCQYQNTLGESVQFQFTLNQSSSAYENYTFAELRSLISAASGEIQITDPVKLLEGIVISDAGNPNMETNPNLTFLSIDFTENARTAYMQSLDGSYGLRIKTASESDNTLTRYSKVSIKLAGLTLKKESNPERYTLSGLTASNILSTEAGTVANVVSKLKNISSLTDADIYTYVRLTNVECALPYGSYFNANVGYAKITNWNALGTTGPRLDAAPTLLKDNEGNSLNLLTNMGASWARNTLPTGAGSVNGIVVHSKLLRYGYGDGFIGTYALRILDESAVSLNNPVQSRTLVEWNWIGSTTKTASTIVTNADGSVAPKIGSGDLSCTLGSLTPSLGSHPIYHENPASKDIPNSALTYAASWWNTATNLGEGFVCKFSTSGVTGNNLTIDFSQGGGSGSITTQHVPVYWQIEYSTNGTNYTVLPNSTYGVRPLVVYSNTPLSDCPGLISYSFKLPNSLFGQQNIYIKLKVKNNICGTATGAEDGTITATQNNTAVSVRVGVISLKYN